MYVSDVAHSLYTPSIREDLISTLKCIFLCKRGEFSQPLMDNFALQVQSTIPVSDPMKTIAPLVFSKCGSAACVMRKGDLTFSAKVGSKSEGSISRMDAWAPSPPWPAAFTIRASNPETMLSLKNSKL